MDPSNSHGQEPSGFSAAWRLVDKTLAALSETSGAVGAFWTLSLMVLINVDVAMRGAFSAPLEAVPEFVALSITGIVFLQISNAIRADRFITSDALARVIFKLSPTIGRVLRFLTFFAGFLLFATVAWATWPIFSRALERGTYVGAVGGVTFPTWPISLIVIVGSVLACAEYLLRSVKTLRVRSYDH